MWLKDGTTLENEGFVEGSVVREGYVVAEGVSVGYSPLLENTLIGRSVFGDVFHIFKVNPKKPLRVKCFSNNGTLRVLPVGEEYVERFPAQIHADSIVWNASMFILFPGDEKTLNYNEGLKKHVFPDSFVSEVGRNLSSLVNILGSEGVDFDGNYSNLSYSFVPPCQVGNQLYRWIVRRREIVSHKHTFDQKNEGYIEIPQENARKVFWENIVPDLENKFGERIIFSRREF